MFTEHWVTSDYHLFFYHFMANSSCEISSFLFCSTIIDLRSVLTLILIYLNCEQFCVPRDFQVCMNLWCLESDRGLSSVAHVTSFFFCNLHLWMRNTCARLLETSEKYIWGQLSYLPEKTEQIDILSIT